jgi:hypothetical protein
MTVRIAVSVIATLSLLLAGCGGTVTSLHHQIQTASQTSYIPASELGDAGEYWNIRWQGQAAELYARYGPTSTIITAPMTMSSVSPTVTTWWWKSGTT